MSLAEAKTIWALLQDNAFLLSVLFRGSEHLPEVGGFCGAAYSVEPTAHRRLYNKRDGSWVAWAFPLHYRCVTADGGGTKSMGQNGSFAGLELRL